MTFFAQFVQKCFEDRFYKFNVLTLKIIRAFLNLFKIVFDSFVF